MGARGIYRLGVTMKLTTHDILESIEGLRKVGRALRSAAQNEPLPKFKPPAVLVLVSGLLQQAQYLEGVADELQHLIPNEEVTLDG